MMAKTSSSNVHTVVRGRVVAEADTQIDTLDLTRARDRFYGTVLGWLDQLAEADVDVDPGACLEPCRFLDYIEPAPPPNPDEYEPVAVVAKPFSAPGCSMFRQLPRLVAGLLAPPVPA